MIPEVKVPSKKSSNPWRIALGIIAALLVPIFFLGSVFMFGTALQAKLHPPENPTVANSILLFPPLLLPLLYWSLYFTRRDRPWARWILVTISVLTVAFMLFALYLLVLVLAFGCC